MLPPTDPAPPLTDLPPLPPLPLPPTELPATELPPTGLPTTYPPETSPPVTTTPGTEPPATVPTVPPTAAPASHTLVLKAVTGTPTDLRGHFVVDGELVVVAPGTAFGPEGAVDLLGLEETGDGWVAVLQVRTQQPRNHPLGRVLRFS